MFELLQRKGIASRSAHHIANHGWKTSTACRYSTQMKHWIRYCEEKKIDQFNLELDNILPYLEHCLDIEKVSVHGLLNCKSFIPVSRRLSGNPLMEREEELLKKFLSGVHNLNPVSEITAPVNLDVKILLDYFATLPPNKELTMQQLGGKLTLLFLICSISRVSEVHQLCISCIETPRDNTFIIFHLSEPTKTFTFKWLQQKGLQKLIFRTIPGYKYICPVHTLLDYLQKTASIRNNQDKLLILPNGQPAAKATITHWAKDLLQDAGLGNVQVHSTRGSSSMACLVVGMNLSELAEKTGWLSISSFVTSYMKPIMTEAEIKVPLPKNRKIKKATTAKKAMIESWKKFLARVHLVGGARRSAKKFMERHHKKCIKKASKILHSLASKGKVRVTDTGEIEVLVIEQPPQVNSPAPQEIQTVNNPDGTVELDLNDVFDCSFWKEEMGDLGDKFVTEVLENDGMSIRTDNNEDEGSTVSHLDTTHDSLFTDHGPTTLTEISFTNMTDEEDNDDPQIISYHGNIDIEARRKAKKKLYLDPGLLHHSRKRPLKI